MKKKKPKKENKQIVEIHIYIHQIPQYNWNPPTITPNVAPSAPWNYPPDTHTMLTHQ